jgi:cation diffusion facilitator CzcD-associated flavoprotein CzcO
MMQVDIAIVGAGLCGLATAAALHHVRPDLVIKVCS